MKDNQSDYLKSECCFASPLLPTFKVGNYEGTTDKDMRVGFCSICKDNAVFHTVEYYEKENLIGADPIESL